MISINLGFKHIRWGYDSFVIPMNMKGDPLKYIATADSYEFKTRDFIEYL